MKEKAAERYAEMHKDALEYWYEGEIQKVWTDGDGNVCIAYLERGYDAIGGEYLILPVFYWLAGQTIHNFTGFWREIYADRKERSGKASGM